MSQYKSITAVFGKFSGFLKDPRFYLASKDKVKPLGLSNDGQYLIQANSSKSFSILGMRVLSAYKAEANIDLELNSEILYNESERSGRFLVAKPSELGMKTIVSKVPEAVALVIRDELEHCQDTNHGGIIISYDFYEVTDNPGNNENFSYVGVKSINFNSDTGHQNMRYFVGIKEDGSKKDILSFEYKTDAVVRKFEI